MNKPLTHSDLQGIPTTDQALQFYDQLEPVDIDFMLGRWRGAECPTGHYMDGLLDLTGWYGKLFVDADHVHPLLFYNANRTKVYAANPLLIPLSINYPKIKALRQIMLLLRPILRTRRSKARLRMLEHRGKVSAAMIYDEKPIHDCFRKLSDHRVLGLMDRKGDAQPYFFLLERDDSPLPVLL